MENLKIRVNGEAKSKEAQELFFELGYEKGVCSTGGYPALIIATPESRFQKTPYSSRATSLNHEAHSQYKEITLPQLRDLVVLKRNDVEDANYKTNYGTQCYITGEDVYAFQDNKWFLSAMQHKDILDMIKPIEKPMKEYLRKNSDGTYSYIGMVQPENISQNVIEIPEGSETFNYYDRKDNLFFLKGSGEDTMFSNDLNDWDWKHWGNIDFDGVVCLWSRHTHPEELPFIDDEPLLQTATGSGLDQVAKNNDLRELLNSHSQSLNDQYAEIEKVRQSAWQKQEGGSHYKNLKIQPMQYALENKLDYAQANVVKYVTRHKEKNGKEDLLKAIHNLELMIEFYYGDEK